MPLNWNGDYIPSKVNKMTDILSAKEIGGVGQLIYHPLHFADYACDSDGCVHPICQPGQDPLVPEEDILTGKGLLVSLCNLAAKINNRANNTPYADQIIKWCKANMHPYNIDGIYSALNDRFDINGFDAKLVEKDGTFSLSNFMNDLGKLYNAVIFYIALEGVCVADDDAAYSLSKEGKYFKGYSYFEKYKRAAVTMPDEILTDGDTCDDLLENMQRANDYIESHPSEQPTKSEFATTPYNDYEELRDCLISIIPDFKIRLKVNPRTNRLEFSTDVQSVFDIAWYTLARMLSEDPAPKDNGRSDKRPEGIMIRCRNCGKFIIRKSNRQEYCNSEVCQKVRNARKQKAFRERKAIEKAQKAKKKPRKSNQYGETAVKQTASDGN